MTTNNHTSFTDYRRDPRWAYLEFLHYEARLLRMELDPGNDWDFTATGTFANRFHFPLKGNWTDVPKPSTRALQVLRAAGVKIPKGVAA